MSEKPNIVYIHCYDGGRFISPHGYAMKTPNLQKLASSGVLFRNNFCVAPGSSASRASLLTSSYPHQNGMMGLIHRGFSMRDFDNHIIQTLRPHGYKSYLSGVQYIAMAKDGKQGWERIGYDDCIGDIGDAHLSARDFLLKAKKDQPFFLSVGFLENLRALPHVDKEICDPNYCQPLPGLPDTPETRLETARYSHSVYNVDKKIGMILDAIEDSGLSNNTIIICTTTNGPSFPDMKCSLYDKAVGTFLIIKGIGEQSKVIDAMTSHLDIVPTLLEILGVDSEKAREGKSLLSLITGDADELHDQLVFQINYHASAEPTRALRTSRYKYIRRYLFDNYIPMANCDDSIVKNQFIEAGWDRNEPGREQLYDLLLDPNEKQNLVDLPSHKETLRMMQEKLDKWMEDKRDPLILGYLNSPRGAVVNPISHVSPEEVPLEDA